ncbi:MAG: alpha/beta hydrolase [Actinomycetota bacterium]|nr:alpha/beta hydrolase [Actinomycetota bacterium]
MSQRTVNSYQLTIHHAARAAFDADGRQLAVLRAAPRQPTGICPIVLMVPGYTGSKEDFAPLLDPLADNGFHAVAIDLPGQYESAGPSDEAGYSPNALGVMLAGMIAQLPGPVILLGHSYGGLVARAAVLAGSRVAGLVLLDSGPAALPAGPRTLAMEGGAPVLRDQGIKAAYEFRRSLTADLRRPPTAELEGFYRKRFLASAPAGLLGMAAAIVAEPDLVTELAAALDAATIPVAVISGEADDAWGIEQQAAMARRLGTSLLVIPGAAHSPNVEQPERLLRILLPRLRSWTTGSRAVPPSPERR